MSKNAKLIRCSNIKCDNHTPDSQAYFNWTIARVTRDRVVFDDAKTELAYCFSCPMCMSDAEDFNPTENHK